MAEDLVEVYRLSSPADGTARSTDVCTCRQLTAGVCPACQRVRVPTLTLDVRGVDSALRGLRRRLAELIRDLAASEAGPVGVRLRQVADVFEQEG